MAYYDDIINQDKQSQAYAMAVRIARRRAGLDQNPGMSETVYVTPSQADYDAALQSMGLPSAPLPQQGGFNGGVLGSISQQPNQPTQPSFNTQWNKPMYPELQGRDLNIQPPSGSSSGIPSEGVYRDLNNNFYYNGQPINLDKFKQLGINADFVKPGESVSLTQATTGKHPAEVPVVDQLQQYIDSLYNQGYVLNPDIQLTPEKIAEFTAQASAEIDPYYKTQLKLAREQLLSTQGYTADQINQYETNLERQYGQQLKDFQASEADKGFAQSGERVLGEQNLATDAQNLLNQNRASSQQTLMGQGRTFAQNYGGLFGEQVPQGPQIGATPQVQAGQLNFNRSGQTSPFYTLSPDVYDGLTGTQEFNRRSSELGRASDLESAYRTQQTIPTNTATRNLII